MTDVRTHHRGLVCTACDETLEPGCCDGAHGHDEQPPTIWAHASWPDHTCFEPTP